MISINILNFFYSKFLFQLLNLSFLLKNTTRKESEQRHNFFSREKYFMRQIENENHLKAFTEKHISPVA